MVRAHMIAALIVIAGCAAGEGVQTFRGEPIRGGAEDTVVIDTIDHPDLPSVLLISSEGELELGIYQAKTGRPYLTLRDVNNDGVFDMLTYSSLSRSGEIIVEVEDYGMDGQPDFILNHRKKKASVYYRRSWHNVAGVGTGQPATIKVDGKPLLLEDVLNELRENERSGT